MSNLIDKILVYYTDGTLDLINDVSGVSIDQDNCRESHFNIHLLDVNLKPFVHKEDKP